MSVPDHTTTTTYLAQFPLKLKRLVEAELVAGNSILEYGGGHPAPPAGGMIKLAKDLQTDLPSDLSTYARNTSLYHTEITDGDRRYWILTAPHPPPPPVDMDVIRAKHAPLAPASPPRVHLPGTIQLDIRGEMLIYRDELRKTDIVWTWSNGNRIYPSTLSPWWHLLENRTIVMTEEERTEVLQRFIDFARLNIASDIIIKD